VSIRVEGQCPRENGLVYSSDNKTLNMDSIAQYCAPMLWFSPDEPNLYNGEGKIHLPVRLPYDKGSETQPSVYYKVKRLYTTNSTSKLDEYSFVSDNNKEIDLSLISALEIEYYIYYASESGLNGHPHDLESVAMQLKVYQNSTCLDERYAVETKRIIARAHGVYWFENAVNVDDQTVLPMSILVEEGKHANCTDKNADGVYTPGFDVTEKVNDAWGVRDIISSGRLYTGGFQGWMAKVRTANSILLPPGYQNTASFEKVKERFPNHTFENTYEVRAFPEMPDTFQDEHLIKMVTGKKYKEWPEVTGSINPTESFFKLSTDNKLRNKVGFTYRWDEGSGLSMTLPLLIVKHVEAPMTGGWFYNKVYIGNVRQPEEIGYRRLWGHQIQHTNSASRWLDTYIGMGYDVLDLDPTPGNTRAKAYLATEVGLKIRVNITVTPLKFLKILGTDYWGIKLGWKNLGFNPYFGNGLVVEFGAGAF